MIAEKSVKTICPYCGVGCGLVAKVRNERIVEVRGDKDHPSNRGALCSKGAQIDQIAQTKNRLSRGLWRDSTVAPFEAHGLDETLRRVATKLKGLLQHHGPDAVGFYVSGQLTTEAQYVFNKLAKGALGTNHIDANSRLCMASAASAYKLAFGSDGPPTCYDDIELAECFLIVGANMADCHPVLWQRIKKRLSRKRTRVIVVDPRRTATAEAAHLHLAIQPGTDVALLNAILHILIAQQWTNERFLRQHTENWEALRDAVEAWSPARAAKVCGLDELDIHRAAFWFGASAEALSFYAMGANQSTSGVAKNLAIINLHLATGKIGRPGSGPFSLTGQPNAMGGREVGYMSGLLPGYRQVNNPEHRRAVARIWGVPEGRIRPEPGLDAVQMFEAAETGRLKALWLAGCNPYATMPNANQVRRALTALPFLIVQDCYHPTETTALAHAVLPAAMSLEVEGTMTNSERRISLLQPCLSPPGEARPDWEIAARVAALLGYEEQFSFSSAADVFEEHRLCCSSTYELQMEGLSYRRLRRQPGQWPCPDSSRPGLARRYRRKVFPTPSGRARLHVVEYFPPADGLTPQYPLALTTGRLANHWHTRTKTGHVPKLNAAQPNPFVAAHSLDAQALGLREGDLVRVISRRGFARTSLKLDDTLLRGTIFMPFHWGQSFREDGCVNAATTGEADPISRQPELKFSAVRLEKDG
jgi:anaerobic selenocysteine-containing dehydrogenase